MAIDLSAFGVGSGLDTNGIINGLVAAEQVPLNTLQQKQANTQAASQTVSAFTSKLSALQSAATALSTPTGLNSFTATSSDTSVAASTTGGAAPGTYTINVDKVAAEQRTYTDPQTSASTALGITGTLGITIGSNTVNVSVTAADTLTDIASKISGSGARATASILFDGTTYRMQVRGLDTGAANAISFDDSGVPLGLSTAANTVQSASDASLKIDGFTVTRSSNQITGVIPGVTLALTKPTTSPVTINVAADPNALATKLQSFVTAFNAVVASGHAAAGYGSAKASNALLAGDTSIRSSLDAITNLVSGNTVPGTSGTYTTLGTVGFKLSQDGTISLDTAKLTTAVQNDAASVARLFVTDSTTGATGMMSTVVSTIDALATATTSPLQTRIQSLSKQASQMTDQEDQMQRRLDAYTTQLKAQFTALDSQVNAYRTQQNAIASLTTTTK